MEDVYSQKIHDKQDNGFSLCCLMCATTLYQHLYLEQANAFTVQVIEKLQKERTEMKVNENLRKKVPFSLYFGYYL